MKNGMPFLTLLGEHTVSVYKSVIRKEKTHQQRKNEKNAEILDCDLLLQFSFRKASNINRWVVKWSISIIVFLGICFLFWCWNIFIKTMITKKMRMKKFSTLLFHREECAIFLFFTSVISKYFCASQKSRKTIFISQTMTYIWDLNKQHTVVHKKEYEERKREMRNKMTKAWRFAFLAHLILLWLSRMCSTSLKGVIVTQFSNRLCAKCELKKGNKYEMFRMRRFFKYSINFLLNKSWNKFIMLNETFQ